jgi:hypothetical protein
LRRAGAVEFMAPEQNEGQMLFHSDVYSFGVVIFELLAGRVPFPLQDKGETARNNVRLAHVETPPPDLLLLRKENLPAYWTQEKKEREMMVPDWLLMMVYKCLEKKPSDRFVNGIELHDFVTYNSVHSVAVANRNSTTQPESENLEQENGRLLNELAGYKQKLKRQEEELTQLRSLVEDREENTAEGQIYVNQKQPDNAAGVSKTAYTLLLFITICLAAFSAYSYLSNRGKTEPPAVVNSVPAKRTETKASSQQSQKKQLLRKKDSSSLAKHISDSIRRATKKKPAETDSTKLIAVESSASNESRAANAQGSENTGSTGAPKYSVISKAYFYNSPDETSRRNAYINKWNGFITATDELNGFIYVVYTNEEGQTSRGWLKKSDLRPYNKQ